jgi:hypothetical protein
VINSLPVVLGGGKVVINMGDAPKKLADDTQAIIDGWTELAATASFAGMTLAEYKAAVQPSFDSRQKIKDLETDIDAEIVNRDHVDETTGTVNASVVKSIVADKNYGDDSALYERIGYVRKSAHASGLTHKSNATAKADAVKK